MRLTPKANPNPVHGHAGGRRRGPIWLSAFVVAGVVAGLMFATTNHNPSLAVPNLKATFVNSSSSSSSGSGSCDVTGVNVSYTTAYRASPVGYYVTSVKVSNITWPSCSGAQLTVSLTNPSNTTIGSGTVTLPTGSPSLPPTTTSATVPISPQPLVHDVTGVSVTLNGGTTPIPPQCSGITFSYIFVASNGNQTINGTNGNDLIYSQSGVDTITGLQGNDCLNGGPNVGDNDTITDGNGNDVVLAGNGTDSVNVGNGTDLVQLGDGADNVTIGNGSDTVKLGNGNNTVAVPVGNGPDTITVGNGNNTVHLGNGADSVTVGNGTNVTYFGTGATTFNGGTPHNTCYVPHAAIPKDTIHNCTVVST